MSCLKICFLLVLIHQSRSKYGSQHIIPFQNFQCNICLMCKHIFVKKLILPTLGCIQLNSIYNETKTSNNAFFYTWKLKRYTHREHGQTYNWFYLNNRIIYPVNIIYSTIKVSKCNYDACWLVVKHVKTEGLIGLHSILHRQRYPSQKF